LGVIKSGDPSGSRIVFGKAITLFGKRLSSAKGATSSQPGPTAQETNYNQEKGLKARPIAMPQSPLLCLERAMGRTFSPLDFVGMPTWAGGPGWDKSGPLALSKNGDIPTQAWFSPSLEETTFNHTQSDRC